MKNSSPPPAAFIDTSGKVAGALDFSGDDGVYLEGTSEEDSPFNIYNTNLTISAWIKIRGSGTIVARAKSGYITYLLGVMGGKAFINTYKGGSGHWILYGDRILYANTWYHVVGVFDRDGDKGYVYVDGVKEGEASMTTDPLSNDAITRIGCRSSTSDSAFNGLIDDVMLFDRALSGDEIQTLFNFGNLSYDAAGNLTQDQRGYEYEYDYENRIVKITKGTQTKAEFAYDALGRRIKKYDSISAETTLYYYNKDWQVTCEYDDSNNLQRYFVYGNYIDEVLLMNDGSNEYYYVHDHLYSPVALVNTNDTVVERYEYDAYGNVKILDASYEPRETSNYNNPYYFTGRELDVLDSGSLKIMYYRNRFYDTYTGRFIIHDPLGIIPNPQSPNRFKPIGQYVDAMNLYQYVDSNPVVASDPWGLQAPISIGIGLPPFTPPGPEPLSMDCPDDGCPSGWLDPLPSTGRSGDWTAAQAFWHFLWGDGANVEFSHLSTFAWRCSVPTPTTEGISTSFHFLSKELKRKAKTIGTHLQPCRCSSFSSFGISAWGYVYGNDLDWSGTLSMGQNNEYSTLKYRAKCCLKKFCLDSNFKGKLVCRIRWDIYDLFTWEMEPLICIWGDDYWQIVHFDKNLRVEIDL